jgi:DNA-binding NarL/FixJ family response regulator
VIAVHDGRVSAPELWRAKRAGARATVPFSAGIEPLAMAVRARVVASLPSVIDLVTRQPLPDVSGALTPREIEVLECIAAGCNLREAGERLGISPKTVDNHKQRIFAKLGVQTQAHAISVAIRRGILASATQPEPISTGP